MQDIAKTQTKEYIYTDWNRNKWGTGEKNWIHMHTVFKAEAEQNLWKAVDQQKVFMTPSPEILYFICRFARSVTPE